MLESLIVSLFLTIIIEVPIAFCLGIRNRNNIKIAILVNIITNPVVVFTANCIRILNNIVLYNIVVFVLEISAIIVEFLLYKKFLYDYNKSPLGLSLICNIISFSVGVILNCLI